MNLRRFIDPSTRLLPQGSQGRVFCVVCGAIVLLVLVAVLLATLLLPPTPAA